MDIDDLLYPLITFFGENPDFDYQDELKEAELLASRNAKLEQVIRGEADMDDYLEMLFEHSIDPIEWVDAAVDNMQYIIDSGIVYAQTESGIYIPR